MLRAGMLDLVREKRFADRTAAGAELGRQLAMSELTDPLVLGLTRDDLVDVVATESDECQRRLTIYQGGSQRLAAAEGAGRTVVVVDDGADLAQAGRRQGGEPAGAGASRGGVPVVRRFG